MTRLDHAFEYIDRFAKNFMTRVNTPGLAVAVTDREQLLWISTYGVTDIPAKTPVTQDTVFEIGSLGKPFTSIPLLQLRDEGKLDLKKPVSEYLPWFQVKSDYPPVTVHNLMNHTSGLIRGTDVAPHGLYESWALRDTQAAYPPGDYFWYSNIGYKTLGFLLEELTGNSFPEVIQSQVLDRLGMSQTYPVITHETRQKTATGHTTFYDDRPDHPSHGLVPCIWSEYGAADGCLASTVGDMAIYLRMLLNRGNSPKGRLLSEQTFDLMALNGIWTGGDFYGYGLATYDVEGRTYIGHGGGNAGFRSAIVVDLEAGLGVVFLLNLMGETDPIVAAAQHALTAVRAADGGQQLPAMPAFDDPTSVPNAADYAGTYRSGDRTLRLTTEDGKLVLQHHGTSIALERRTPDNFYVGHPDFELFLLEFRREGSKVVEVFHGPEWYTGESYTGPQRFNYPAEWENYLGHYRARNPEVSNFRIVLRKGSLVRILPWGTSEHLEPHSSGSFRVGADERSPETLQFSAEVEGKALRADFSGCPYYRTFTP